MTAKPRVSCAMICVADNHDMAGRRAAQQTPPLEAGGRAREAERWVTEMGLDPIR